MDGLTAGRIVHYVMPDGRYQGEHRAAIVIKVWGDTGTCQLGVFVDGTNDYPRWQFTDASDSMQPLPLAWKTSVTFDEDEKKPGTWHWIERA